jgi:hypothetical protein
MSFFFTPDDVRQGLRELAQELRAAGMPAKVQVVGGAAVALQVGREALTRDIDALHPATPQFADIVRLIADRRGWPENWLNDAVKGFASHYDSTEDWEVLEDGEGVTVLVARPQLLLAMKLLAGRGTRDREDIERLLDACSVVSYGEAKAIFDQYYPMELMSHRARAQLVARYQGVS